MRLFTIVLIVLFISSALHGGFFGAIGMGIFLFFVWFIAMGVWSAFNV